MDWLRSWTGRARLTFTHHVEPVTLHLKSGESTSLLELCESATPPCQLNPFLFNGHLQTCYSAAKDPIDVPIHYKRRLFEAEAPNVPGTFAADFVVPPYEERDDALPPRTTYFSEAEFRALGKREQHTGAEAEAATGAEALADDDDRPMLLCLHGLTGGSYEPYLRAVLEPLVEAGWAACVINSRGCAKSKITTPILYNARTTWDLRQMAKWCRKTWPKRKLYGIGFSLGASMMANYLGEEGGDCLLEAAVVCSNPWTLEVGSLGLQRTFIGKQLYSRTMGTNLKNVVKDHFDMLQHNPNLDLDALQRITYLHEFDREIQCRCWGYPTENAYYRDATSTDALFAIRVPLLSINAEDDPIALNEAIPYEEFKQNPYTILLTSSMGGHLSWFEMKGRRWFAKPAANFLMKMHDEVKLVGKPAPSAKITENGWQISPRKPEFLPSRHKLLLAEIS